MIYPCVLAQFKIFKQKKREPVGSLFFALRTEYPTVFDRIAFVAVEDSLYVSFSYFFLLDNTYIINILSCDSQEYYLWQSIRVIKSLSSKLLKKFINFVSHSE